MLWFTQVGTQIQLLFELVFSWSTGTIHVLAPNRFTGKIRNGSNRMTFSAKITVPIQKRQLVVYNVHTTIRVLVKYTK